MVKIKSVDRHVEPEMVVYTVRLRVDHLEILRSIAKKEDRTRQSLIRDAISDWIKRREK